MEERRSEMMEEDPTGRDEVNAYQGSDEEPAPQEITPVADFEPLAEESGLDAPTRVGSEISPARSKAGAPGNEYDWQVHVDVDQPVQKAEE